MFHELASIFLIKEPCLIKPPRVLADSFCIRTKHSNNILQCYTIAFRNKKQYFNAVMVRYTLEMPFHLFCGFFFYHMYSITQHPYKLQFVGMFFVLFYFFVICFQSQTPRRIKFTNTTN